MHKPSATRTDFINQVLTSSFPGEVAKRFLFADGEVGALYTMGRNPVSGEACPVVLYISTFPPRLSGVAGTTLASIFGSTRLAVPPKQPSC